MAYIFLSLFNEFFFFLMGLEFELRAVVCGRQVL
jgi:hypothetical protein